MITTERLKLVPPSLALQPQMLNAILSSQNELGEYLPWVPHALTEQASIEDTEKAIRNFDKFEEELRFSIIHSQSEELIGAIGLIIRDKSVPFFEIGYWLRTESTGLGYVTEAVKGLEQYAFDHLKANRVEIRAAEGNAKSRNIAERCGYHLEGVYRNDRLLPSGELSNTAVYSKIAL